MAAYTKFYIVRHGETEWNLKRLLQGHGDSPLTLKGEDQAKALGKEFENIVFDEVFSSDLLRAKRTAELIILEKKLAVKTSQLLRERRYGKYEGKQMSLFLEENQELIKKFSELSSKEQVKFKYADDIDCNDDLVTRLITFLRETAVAYEGKTILVVSHGSIIKALLIHLGHALGGDVMKNGAYVKLESDGVDFFIKEMQGISPGESDTSNFHPRKTS